MYYVVETDKSFDQATADLEAAVKGHSFGVLHTHDLGATLRSKGFDFPRECRVLEVCNPGKANDVMSIDMRLNMALPCRISVYTENGKTMIGMIKPEAMLAGLSRDPALGQIAREVEAILVKVIDEAA